MSRQPEFDITASGDVRAAQKLSMLAKRGGDARPAFRKILDELRVAEVEWFASHGAGAWPELAEVTRERKARLGLPSEPLVATDALRQSLITRSGHKGKRTATRASMRFGTRVWYARFHAGGTKGTRGLPVRNPVIPVDLRTRRRMVDEVRAYLLSQRRGLVP